MVAPALARMAGKDIRLLTRTRLVAVGDNLGSVRLQGIHDDEPFEVQADSVVFISHNRPLRELVDELDAQPFTVVAVGDAMSPRFLENAIREGHMAARTL